MEEIALKLLECVTTSGNESLYLQNVLRGTLVKMFSSGNSQVLRNVFAATILFA
jgi:hypothetical protein